MSTNKTYQVKRGITQGEFVTVPQAEHDALIAQGFHGQVLTATPTGKTDKQVCALRELVLAHHAYKRSLNEFAATLATANMPKWTEDEIHTIGGAVSDIVDEEGTDARAMDERGASYIVNVVYAELKRKGN